MSRDYMENIYDALNAPEVEYDEQGIEYLDDPVEENEFNWGWNDELSWADDITFLDEPEEENMDYDLGEGFIQLYPGEEYQEELIVIDENYILDDCEGDLTTQNYKPSVYYDPVEEPEEKVDVENYVFDINGLLDNEEESLAIDVDKVQSIIKFSPNDKIEEDEFEYIERDEAMDKLATSIAKEHMENIKAGDSLGLFGDVTNPDDDTSWVDDDKDMFGADISVIIGENPNAEVEEDDFVEGSFNDWLKQQQNQ